MEWLDDPEMKRQFDSIFGTEIREDSIFAHENVRKSKHNFEVAESLDKSPLQWLRDLNRFDIDLYEWAKELTRSRMDATQQRRGLYGQPQQQQLSPLREGQKGQSNKDRSGPKVAAFDMTLCRDLPPIPRYTVHGIAYADLIEMPMRSPPLCNYPIY